MSKSDKESLTQDMKEASKEQAKEATNMKKDTENKDEHSVERKKKKKEPQLPISESPQTITYHSSGGSFASDEVPHHAAAGPVAAAANWFAHEVVPDHKVEEGVVGGGSSGFLMSKKEVKLNKALLGLRIIALVFCLISFSVMADIRKKGAFQISFYDFVEFKYALSMNVIGFVYSGVQIVMKYLITEKQKLRLRYFSFFMDQALTYLLLSASTSAATEARRFWIYTRVVNKFIQTPYDDFIEMAHASIALSFFAFKAFALATLISGYMLFGFKN